MQSIFIAGIIVASMAAQIQAQDLPGKISCYTFGGPEPESKNSAHITKLWSGYEISLGPVRDNPDEGNECTAAIYTRAGHVVFRTTGFSVVLDETHTGQDFDGDGHPEAVFLTDTGGGNHCCWAYHVISLFPRPHRLFALARDGEVRFEKDHKGKMIIWQRVPGVSGFTSMADRPFAERVFRVREGKLVDSTPEFCSRIFSNENRDYESWNMYLTPEDIKILQATGYKATDYEARDNERIVSDILSRAEQHVFCRDFDAILDDLNLWPKATRIEMATAFADWMKGDYPELAARLPDALSKK